MAKSFALAPKPTSDIIAAYERRGLGHDTNPQTHQPTKQEERTKRLSIDMPESLHRRFKVACAKHGLSMVGEALQFFERRTTELEGS
jgi:ParG